MIKSFSLVLAFLYCFEVIAVSAEKPNIVLIMADDMGDTGIDCYGSEIQTPVLDRLAENGQKS